MNTELNVAKQEICTFMQKATKNNQDMPDSFCRSELDNARKFSELDWEEAGLEQISKVVNNTIVQRNNCTLSDASQVQPGKSGNNAVSAPCTSNSSSVIESVEIGCSHGMNGNVLSGNVCSMTPTTSGGQIFPALSLPTFSSQEQNAVHF